MSASLPLGFLPRYKDGHPAGYQIVDDFSDMLLCFFLRRLVLQHMHKNINLHMGDPVDRIIIDPIYPSSCRHPVCQETVMLFGDRYKLIYAVLVFRSLRFCNGKQQNIIILIHGMQDLTLS